MNDNEDVIVLSEDECVILNSTKKDLKSHTKHYDDIYVESETIVKKKINVKNDDFDADFDVYLEACPFIRKRKKPSSDLTQRVCSELNREFLELKNSNQLFDDELPCSSSSLNSDKSSENIMHNGAAKNINIESQKTFNFASFSLNDFSNKLNDIEEPLYNNIFDNEATPDYEVDMPRASTSYKEFLSSSSSNTVEEEQVMEKSPAKMTSSLSSSSLSVENRPLAAEEEPHLQPLLLNENEKNEAARSLDGKKKRRTKEEIEHDKLVKEVTKIRREMNAAKNSKCEQYLFCYVSPNILAMDEQIQPELTLRFNERSISEQLIFGSKLDTHVIWKRKRVDAYIEDGKLHTETIMNQEGVFMALIDAEFFMVLVKTKEVMKFLENRLADYKINDPQLTVVVFGKCNLRDSTINDILFESFERFRVQFRFIKGAVDLSFLVAQMHRAIAKNEKKAEQESLEVPVIDIQKGVRDGPHLVRDWWSRMLDHVHRMSEEQKRALIDRYPSPMNLMEELLAEENACEAMYKLANVSVNCNKCLGPVIAQKLYMMLTSWDGSEIIHSS